MLDSKGIDLKFEHSNSEPFLYIGIILLIFKIEGNIPEENDWLKKIASWSYTALFNSFRILVGILLGPSLIYGKDNVGNFSTISWSYKNYSIFRGGR